MKHSYYLILTYSVFVLLMMTSCVKFSTDFINDTLDVIQEAKEKRDYSPLDPLASEDAIGIHLVLDGVIYKGFNTRIGFYLPRFFYCWYSFWYKGGDPDAPSFSLSSEYEYRFGVTQDKGYGFTDPGSLSFFLESESPIEPGTSICFDSNDYSQRYYFKLRSSLFQVANEQYIVTLDRIDVDNGLFQLSFEGEISTQDGKILTVREGLLRVELSASGLEQYQAPSE